MGNQRLPEGAYLGADNELRIIRAIEDDEGEYQCSAKNSVGTTWSDPIMLNVIICKKFYYPYKLDRVLTQND
jgi:hypothetical protein